MSETPIPAAKPTAHLGWLDAVRGLMAMWVVVHHSQLTIDFDPANAIQKAVHSVFRHGHFAVTMFIAISGFSLTMPVVRKGWEMRGGWWGFLRARFIRILPSYYLAMAFSLLLIVLCVHDKTGTQWDVSLPVTTSGVLQHLFLVHNLTRNTEINHAFWSIATEFQIYFLFPVLVGLVRRKHPVGAALVLLLATYLMTILDATVSAFLPGYLITFGSGIVASTLFVKKISVPKVIGWPLALTLLFVGQSDWVPNWVDGRLIGMFHDIVFGAGSALFLLMAGQTESVGKLLGAKPLAFMGTFAYSIYLVHAPLVQIVFQSSIWRWVHSPFWQFVALGISASIFTLIISYGFYLLAEKPFIRIRYKSPTA